MELPANHAPLRNPGRADTNKTEKSISNAANNEANNKADAFVNAGRFVVGLSYYGRADSLLLLMPSLCILYILLACIATLMKLLSHLWLSLSASVLVNKMIYNVILCLNCPLLTALLHNAVEPWPNWGHVASTLYPDL